MTDDLDALVLTRNPTAEHPLLGLTVLVVEDSRYASEALRLLCLKSGARIRRADSIHSARRHLSVYRPTVTIIDLGLPDGNGVDLIRDLATSSPRISVILGASADPSGYGLALKSGADGFLEKPLESVGAFQQAILKFLPDGKRPKGPRLIADEKVVPDEVSLRDDLAHISEILGPGPFDPKAMRYGAQFLAGLALVTRDAELEAAADSLTKRLNSAEPVASDLAQIVCLLQTRLNCAELAFARA